jgi:AcrR family transcriptional regulator
LDALVRGLRTRGFDEISVRELCHEAGVSEPTFFNYFGSKREILVFFVQLWSVEMQHRIQISAGCAFEALLRLFTLTAEAAVQTPRLMYEIISHQVRTGALGNSTTPSPAELALRFADLPGAAERSPASVGSIVGATVHQAVCNGELPRSTNLFAAQSLIVSLFFGAPAAHPDARDIALAYSLGLHTIWRGLGGEFASKEERA